jgi:hypothetical protein
MASQRSRLVTRDLQKFKTASGTDSFHSYDPREKVRTSAPQKDGSQPTPACALHVGV